MTCSITRPDPQTLFNRIRDMFSANVLGGSAVIPESNEWYVVSNDYAMQEQLYAIADQMWKETNPETACCENLIAMASRNGVYPKPATSAQGYAELTGDPGAAIPATIEISTSVGTFRSTGTVPSALTPDGKATVRIKALSPGEAGNSSGTVTTGQLTTTAPGINTQVTILGGTLCGGAEAETCEAFRTRYLNRLAYKPRATSAWIQDKFMEYPCVTRVCTREGSCCRCDPQCGNCGCLACGDRMEFYVFFDNSFPCGIAPVDVVEDLNKWMFGEHQGYGEGQVEIGVCGAVHVAYPLYVNVWIDIVGCPTISQKDLIEQYVRDLFTKICPSVPLRKKQVELVVSQVVGTDVDVDVQFDVIDYDRTKVYISDCGDLEPECDWIPCLKDIEFIGTAARQYCTGTESVTPDWAIGPPGPPGPAGPPGPVGATGRRGSIWTSGDGPPQITGHELPGDMYLNNLNGDICRFNGMTWQTGVFV